MAKLVENFVDAMLQLLPRGQAWPGSRASELAQLLWPMAQEFHRIDLRNDKLLLEMSPLTTQELFDEREAELGLPGSCIIEEQNAAERRSAMVARYFQVGEQSRQMFIDTAARLGFSIAITEYDADNPGPQNNYNGIPLAGDGWNFVWQIDVAGVDGERLTVGSEVGSPLKTWTAANTLECTLRALAHDHRVLFFNYL